MDEKEKFYITTPIYYVNDPAPVASTRQTGLHSGTGQDSELK
ncbi:MAG: hypothetical protein Q8P83_01565 [bacterium]|nr:hypothetical protein [bacterium]